MIKDVSQKLSRISSLPINSSDTQIGRQNSHRYLFQHNQDYFVLSDSDGKNQTNPFQKNSNHEVQQYFDKKYSDINTKVQDVIYRFSENGPDKRKIDEKIIEIGAVVARYEYNKTLPQENSGIGKYEVEENEKENTLKIFNYHNELESKAKFHKGQLLKINYFDGENEIELTFSKRNLFDRIFDFNNNKLKAYQKRDKDGNLLEEIQYTKTGKVEKYCAFSNSKKQFQITFDCDNLQEEINSYNKNNGKIIPLKYSSFSTDENILCELSYLYSRPSKYVEYDEVTNKLTKLFNLQGLNSSVYKYSFFSSINSQLLASGVL